MVKIIGKIVEEMHEWEHVPVMRPYGNEYLIQVYDKDNVDVILKAVQRSVDEITPYVMNCLIGNWTGRATSYITIQPMNAEQDKEFMSRFKEIKVGNACLYRESSFEGRIQLVIHTPCPGDPIKPSRTRYNVDNLFRLHIMR